jgi:hypothetical protein
MLSVISECHLDEANQFAGCQAASGAYARYAEQDEPGLYLVHPQDERVTCTCE